MRTLEHKKQILHIIQTIIPSVIAIYLFGTTGTEYEREESDIDLAILADRKIEIEKRMELTSELSLFLKKDVDLIDLLSVPAAFIIEIVDSGEQIFCSDDEKARIFEMYSLSKRAIYHEEIRSIINDIKKRGSIY